MKIARYCSYLCAIIFFISCGGSLTPEQREKARKAIEEGKIKRITEAQLTESALSTGKKIAEIIINRDPFLNNQQFIDSVSTSNSVLIYALRPGATGLSKEESQLTEAYQTQGEVTSNTENVQRLPGDSLLFTLPVGNERPDGSRPFSHAIAIKMSVKQIVLSIKD